jgi:exonuclease SbcC
MAICNAAEAKAKAFSLAKEAEAAKETHAACKITVERATVTLATAQALAAPLAAHRLAVSNMEKAVTERTTLGVIDAAITTKRKQLIVAKQKVSQAQLSLQAAKASSADVQRAWIDGQSARLAQKLVAGEPCPVCGGKDHPLPASSDEPVPSDEELKETQTAVDAQSSVVERENAAFTKLEGDIAADSAAAGAIRQSLAEAANEDIASLRMRLTQQKLTLQRSNDASDSVKSKEGELSKAANAEAIAKQSEEAFTATLQEAVVTARTTEAMLSECRKGIPEKLTTVALLDEELNRLKVLVDAIDLAVKHAIDKWNTAQQSATAATEKLNSAHTESLASEMALRNAKDEFAQKRTECGFASDAELTTSKRTDLQLSGLREAVETHSKSLSAAMDRATRASEAVADLHVPDLEASKSLAQSTRKRLDDGIAVSGNLKRDLEIIAKALTDLDVAWKELSAFEAQYAVLGRIAEVADGKNNVGLKFSRFVLGFLLDDVLIAATKRLKIMSKGRYELQRRKERADARSHGGLDLEVFDAHTGFSRAAATLSGGESFLASLSLALGLADVVQAQSGGIRMETMFIDEGFGSLDSETVDLAIRSLIELFNDGRLIGIISHVTELQERIDARLEIAPTIRGSAAKFVLR